jgi:hypothetical protein
MPAGKAMFQMGVFAEFERAIFQERAGARVGKGQERRRAPRPAADPRRCRASYQKSSAGRSRVPTRPIQGVVISLG